MSTTEVWFLAFALAMDCFTVSLATGIANKRFHPRRMSLMAVMFGLFQGGMTVLGCLTASLFSRWLAPVDHWIAFALLTYLGIRMIRENFGNRSEQAGSLLRLRNIAVMSVATSIDALAVGVSFAFLGMNSPEVLAHPAAVIALVSGLMSLTGSVIGVGIGRRVTFPMEALGGLILIIIGAKILFEHLTTA